MEHSYVNHGHYLPSHNKGHSKLVSLDKDKKKHQMLAVTSIVFLFAIMYV